MPWTYKPKTPGEALKIALFEAYKAFRTTYQADHGTALPAHDAWVGLATFLTNQLQHLALDARTTEETLLDSICDYAKARWAEQRAERAQHDERLAAFYRVVLQTPKAVPDRPHKEP